MCGCRALPSAAVPAGHAQDSELLLERKPLLLLAKGEPCPSKGKQAKTGVLVRFTHVVLFFVVVVVSFFFFYHMNKSLWKTPRFGVGQPLQYEQQQVAGVQLSASSKTFTCWGGSTQVLQKFF